MRGGEKAAAKGEGGVAATVDEVEDVAEAHNDTLPTPTSTQLLPSYARAFCGETPVRAADEIDAGKGNL